MLLETLHRDRSIASKRWGRGRCAGGGRRAGGRDEPARIEGEYEYACASADAPYERLPLPPANVWSPPPSRALRVRGGRMADETRPVASEGGAGGRRSCGVRGGALRSGSSALSERAAVSRDGCAHARARGGVQSRRQHRKTRRVLILEAAPRAHRKTTTPGDATYHNAPALRRRWVWCGAASWWNGKSFVQNLGREVGPPARPHFFEAIERSLWRFSSNMFCC